MPEYQPGAWGYTAAQTLVETVFGEIPPLLDDELTTVYGVQPITDTSTLSLSIALLESSDSRGEPMPGPRWMNTPATFVVVAPHAQMATMSVRMASMHEPKADRYYDNGILTAVSGNGQVRVVAPLKMDESTVVPVALAPGRQVITLTLQSLGDTVTGQPGLMLNFAPEAIDLRSKGYDYPCDISLVGAANRCGDAVDLAAPFAAFGPGWYDAESDATAGWRWASSPAELWYYAPEKALTTMAFTPVALHDATSPDGKGERGQFSIVVNGDSAATIEANVGSASQVQLKLLPGWNKVQLALAAGNFQPIVFEPSSGDARQLSFALADLAFSSP